MMNYSGGSLKGFVSGSDRTKQVDSKSLLNKYNTLKLSKLS